MLLEVKRFEYGDAWTIGKLYVNGVFECYTLEDKVRDVKIAGQTAIPTGSYDVIIDDSSRFKRPMPHVLNVPNFEGIRIHPGNTDKDTEGCILLGTTWAGGDFIGNSKVAFDNFFVQLQDAQTARIIIT